MTVDDNYCAEKVIGSGAYGIVVSAEDKASKKKNKVAIKWIHKAFEDAFELGMGHNLSIAEVSQARNWFYTKACSDACDHVGTTRDHIQKLYNKI